MGASAIRFENWLPQTTSGGVQWWPSPPPAGSEPATTESPQSEPEQAPNDVAPQPIDTPAPIPADDDRASSRARP